MGGIKLDKSLGLRSSGAIGGAVKGFGNLITGTTSAAMGVLGLGGDDGKAQKQAQEQAQRMARQQEQLMRAQMKQQEQLMNRSNRRFADSSLIGGGVQGGGSGIGGTMLTGPQGISDDEMTLGRSSLLG